MSEGQPLSWDALQAENAELAHKVEILRAALNGAAIGIGALKNNLRKVQNASGVKRAKDLEIAALGTLSDTGGYISPIPARVELDYVNRGPGNRPVERRMHFFEQYDGSVQQCVPRYCRECYREKHWKFGQTHG